MTDTLGLPLQEALRLLQEQGCAVRTAEVRSRKGTEGGDARVLRQTEEADGAILLTFARFITSAEI